MSMTETDILLRAIEYNGGGINTLLLDGRSSLSELEQRRVVAVEKAIGMDGAPTFLYSGSAPSIGGFDQWETLVDVTGPVCLSYLFFDGEIAPSTTLKRYLKVDFGGDTYFSYGFSMTEGQNYSTYFPFTIDTEADSNTPASELSGMDLGEKELMWSVDELERLTYSFYGPIYSPHGLKIQYAVGQKENKGTGDASKLNLDVRYELIGG